MPTSYGNESSVRVVVADDNKLMREKVVQLLQPHFDVVGSAADGKAALDMIVLLKPDLMILDISMPLLCGLDVALELTKQGSPVRIIFLTVHEDPDFLKAALEAGASGYVVKSHMVTDLMAAVKSASRGRVYVSPSCTFPGGTSVPDLA
jgi:DNA-binding NarL/FixJ family response regulator